MSNKRKTKPQQTTTVTRTPGRNLAKEVVVAYVHPSEVSAFFMQSHDNLRTYDEQHGRHLAGVLRRYSSANISNARNGLVTAFLEESESHWLLFIDADMVYEPDALEAILENADPRRAPVVGGLCFGMDDGLLFPTMYRLSTKDNGEVGMWRMNTYHENTMEPVSATGAAFLLIHRTVLELVRDFPRPDGSTGFNKVYPWFQETELGSGPCGEDITFCIRAQQALHAAYGPPPPEFPSYVWIDTGVQIGHHKTTILTHDLYQKQLASVGPVPEKEV